MQQLPLVELVKSLHSSTSLDGVGIIGVQHLLSTTHTMIRSLASFGLKPGCVNLLGKCYSTSEEVFSNMTDDGMDISSSSFAFDSYSAFDRYYHCLVKSFLKKQLSKIQKQNFNKIILMDDGGHLLEAANDLAFKNFKFVGIEQTTHGFMRLKSSNLRFPVINVARSPAKLVYESPMIASAAVRRVMQKLKASSIVPQKVLVVGAGYIGKEVFKALRKKYEVYLFDQDKKEGCLLENQMNKMLYQFDVIVGCTGFTSIPASMHRYLHPNCVMISVSSSDHEFDAFHLRKNVPEVSNCHLDLKIHGRLLVNCGFPVNFDGSFDSVPAKDIQLTRALLATAIFQACEMDEFVNGFLPLDIEAQRDIVTEYLKICSHRTESSDIGNPTSELELAHKL